LSHYRGLPTQPTVSINPDPTTRVSETGDQPVTLAQLLNADQPVQVPVAAAEPVKEFGGRKDGPEPTRYGDWEKNGRCIDF
jgi:hypothetical protein